MRQSQRPTPDGRKVPTRHIPTPPRATPETTTNGPTRIRVIGRGQSAVSVAVGGDHAAAHPMSHDHVSVRPLGAPRGAEVSRWRPGYVRPDPFAGCGAAARHAADLRRAALARCEREDSARPSVRAPVELGHVPCRGVPLASRPGYVEPRDAVDHDWCPVARPDGRVVRVSTVECEPVPVPWVRLGDVPVSGPVRDGAPAFVVRRDGAPTPGVVARALDHGLAALARRGGVTVARPVRGAAAVAPVETNAPVVLSRASRRRDRRARARVAVRVP